MQSLNDTEFKDRIMSSSKVVVVDFGANWCGPCKKLKPILEELMASHAEKADFFYVDAGEQPAIAKEFGVMSLPTILFYKNGQVKERIVGLVSREKIIEKIESIG
ncbi:thioredoxin [bacterium]|nr:thioredoxin [candidate division CSSED10-310 bacterium]